MSDFENDIKILTAGLKKLPTIWDGKQCVLELKAADYHWKQMEWWAFYFEYVAKKALHGKMQIPGDLFGKVQFDLKGKINWDLKASAIKSDSHRIILNDKAAMEQSIAGEGYHGEIIALCDVEYNDTDRSFQQWHNELKGGKSNYEKDREKRTAISRYRKTRAELKEILIVVFGKEDLDELLIMAQGRNSNGNPREPKFMLNLEEIKSRAVYSICFE